MRKSNTVLLQSLIGLIPIGYLLSIWNNLPDTVPTHYAVDLSADRFGTKPELSGIVLFVWAISSGVSLLISNLDKFDPKKKYVTANSLIIKISWTVVIFMTLTSTLFVYGAGHYMQKNIGAFSPKYMAALLSLLFVFLGNFMNTIKPNYFIGIKTPWSLENEENWRQTHQLGSKLWFFGGLLMLVLVMVFPSSYAHYILIGGIIVLTIVPTGYSYHVFRQMKRQE
jgi:uncharacterized membrane protein